MDLLYTSLLNSKEDEIKTKYSKLKNICFYCNNSSSKNMLIGYLYNGDINTYDCLYNNDNSIEIKQDSEDSLLQCGMLYFEKTNNLIDSSYYINFNENNNSNQLVFCDLACAKLYDMNVNRLTIDMKQYKNDYLNNKLSKISKKIYNKLDIYLFTQYPELKYKDTEDIEERKTMKKRYISIL
jgi:hypothetical protein